MAVGVSEPVLSARRVALPWQLPAERAALLVRDDHRPFALIGRWAGGGALIGSEPVRVADGGDDPFALLDEQPTLAPGGEGLVGGGWFGYLGYRLGGRIESVGAGPPAPSGLPDVALAFYDHLLRLDSDGRWWFEALWSEGRAAALSERLAVLRRRAGQLPAAVECRTEPWRARPARVGHVRAVAAARERIHAGDLLQTNIATRLQSRLDGDPLDLFVTARTRLPADRSAYLAGPWGAVVSLSPELFLTRHGRTVRSAPIKGTRPASAGPQAGQELAASEKDLAENTMIVDLVRNDLGRVCELGSVAVEALAQARPHAGVWHLVSEVAGRLRAEVGDAELVRACFPPGSVTGAPKLAAMEVIAELESTPRDVFTGAIGFVSPLAGLELSVAIRTFEVRGEEISLAVGGGIVADSEPADEAAECTVKAAPLLAAIGGRLADEDAADAAGPPALLRTGARPLRRPDPGVGVFETLLVRDGAPVELDAHLERLGASVAALYGAGLADDTRERAVACAATAGPAPARLRITYRPEAADRLGLACSPLEPVRAALHLRTVTVPGGIGAHKWADRRLLDALSARCAPAQPLLCDLDGRVLEAARANVFAFCGDGTLRTPPLDGRILPGVTRARVLDLAAELGFAVGEGALTVADLLAAQEVFATGALGGAEPALTLDGHTLGSVGLAERIAAALAGAVAGLAATRA